MRIRRPTIAQNQGSTPEQAELDSRFSTPQLAYETNAPRSTIRISVFSSSLRRRAAQDAPPARQPKMTTYQHLLPFFASFSQAELLLSKDLLELAVQANKNLPFRPTGALVDNGHLRFDKQVENNLFRLKYRADAQPDGDAVRIFLEIIRDDCR
jgi:hypothetical protein